jgi:RHS repeat-associated protein
VQEPVWLGDMPVATLRPSGSTVAVYDVEADRLNTLRQVTRPSDNVQMWTWFSDPFGTTTANSNPAGAGTFVYNLRFPGQIYNSQAGLQPNWDRDYDPTVGRYVESDPIGLAGESYSTYAYVNGNPSSNSDPDGLRPPGTSVPGFSIPIPVPPIAIPGSPENTVWAQQALQQIGDAAAKAAKAIRNACTNDDNFCYQRWEQEDTRCLQWRGLGSRVVAACKTRAADRRNLCTSNGGRPLPFEPPEYSPFRDYPR